MRERGSGSKHFESRDNVGQVQRARRSGTATANANAGQWRSDADEFASYHTDFDLQIALEMDESQGLYDDQAQRSYAQQARPGIQHGMYARAESYNRAPYNQPTYNYPAQRAQLPAARSAGSGIRSAQVVSPQALRKTTGNPFPQPSAARPSLQLSTRTATRPSVRRAPARTFLDDEPVVYPGARKRGWFGKVVIALLLAGAGFAVHTYLDMQSQKPVPVAPPPAAVVDEPAPAPAPAAAAEETTPVAAPAAPALPLTPQERRAAARAARAALVAERRREREEARQARQEARRARAGARTAEADAAAPSRHAKAEPEAEAAPAASKPSHAEAEAEPLAPQDEPVQPKRPAMADTGQLRINTRPWSVVYVDGHAVGHTPQMNLMLPEGQHEITLVNDEMQLRKSLTVNISAGATTTRTLNLSD